MEKIIIKHLGNLDTNPISGTLLNLSINSFKKLYKGRKEIDLTDDSALKFSIDQGIISLRPFERVVVGTGLFVDNVPKGMGIEIRHKSGNVIRHGVIVLNAPGRLDSTYRGEILIVLYNSTQFLSQIKIGDIVAEACIVVHPEHEFELIPQEE